MAARLRAFHWLSDAARQALEKSVEIMKMHSKVGMSNPIGVIWKEASEVFGGRGYTSEGVFK